MSYNPIIYHGQDGDNVVVGSGGEMKVESGGVFLVESGGKIRRPAALVSTATTSTTIPADGLTVLKSTKTKKAVTLAAPAGGERKVIYATNASATGYMDVYSGSATRTFDGTHTILRFKKNDNYVILDALTTARWIGKTWSTDGSTALLSTST